MHRRIVVALAILAISASGMAGCKKKEPEKTTEAPATAPAPAAPAAPSQPGATTTAGGSGEALYKQYCVACHPDGGNTINPKKTLHKADMDANNVKSADDVVKLMRNPGPGMNKFDTNMISDQDAKAIGEYVMATYYK